MNRVAIVTGAGGGIGAAAARVLVGHGFEVVLAGRNRESLDAVASTCSGHAVPVVVDFARPTAAATLVDRAVAEFGVIDVIVNNAGVISTGHIGSVSREDFDRHYAVNVGAPLFLVAAALPWLRRSDDAAIVNVSSSVGSMVKAGTMLYGSSKAALEYLTRAWAYELANDRIRVNCIAPGPVDTPIHTTYCDDVESMYADLSRRIPLGRMGHVDDIAAWVWMLVAPESRWTTGNVVHVDGGQVLGMPEPARG